MHRSFTRVWPLLLLAACSEVRVELTGTEAGGGAGTGMGGGGQHAGATGSGNGPSVGAGGDGSGSGSNVGAGGAGSSGGGGSAGCIGRGCDCDTPEPTCPNIDSCVASLVCNADHVWDCTYVCNGCYVPAPFCELDTVPVCASFWTCESTSTACPAPAPDCGPVASPECPFYPVCHGDGLWACQQSCKFVCDGVAPTCAAPHDNCHELQVCTEASWACAESCL